MEVKKFIQYLDKNYNKIFWAILIVYGIYVLSMFSVFDGEFIYSKASCLYNPVTQYDYGVHFTESVDAVSAFKSNYRIWHYNPLHFAGYPRGIFINIGNHWAFLFQLVFGALFNQGFAFNLSVLFAYLLAPLFAFFSARNFKVEKINSLFFFAFSALFIGGFEFSRNFLIWGMYGFTLAVFISFYTSSLFFKYIQQKNMKDLIKIAFFGSLAFFIHPLSSILCIAVCLPIAIFYFSRISLKDIPKIMGAVAIIVIVNLIWIMPLFKFLYLKDRWNHFLQTSNVYFLHALKNNLFFVLTTILFLFFIYKSSKNKDSRFMKSAVFSYLIFFILSFFGSKIGLGNIQPLRFIVPLILFPVLAASNLIKSELTKKNVVFLLVFGALFVYLFAFPVKMACGVAINPEIKGVLDFIDKTVTDNVRLSAQSLDNPPYGVQLNPHIPYLTSKQILDGPYRLPPTKFGFVQFNGDTLFGKDLKDISKNMLTKYLGLYNIKYFLVISENANNFFSLNTDFKKIANFGVYSIYEYLYSDESFCYKCNASVKAEYDKITVKNATSNKTILKYHYIKTLKVKPEHLRIRPIKIVDDPVPFIIVENEDVPNFIVYNQ